MIKVIQVNNNGSIVGQSELKKEEQHIKDNPLLFVVDSFDNYRGKMFKNNQWVNDNSVVEVNIKLSKLAFLERFTDAELESIFAAEKVNKKLTIFLKKIEWASEIDLNDERVNIGLNALEKIGLLSIGRANEILAV
jgi:hypothetical protein